MDFSPFIDYKVIEAARVIAIVPRDGIVPGANNLVIGSMESCRYYLDRYLDARMRGLDVKRAHAHALEGAIINSGVAIVKEQI